MLEIARKADWEKVEGLHHELLSMMEALQSSGPLDLSQQESVAQVEHLQELLRTTIALCVERKEQIAGLVNAFAKATTPPHQP